MINNETEHEVTFSSDYYLGVTTVTWGQFAAFVKDDGYQTDPEKGPGGTAWVDDQKDWIRDKKFSWRNTGYEQTDEHPVANVSWNDAVAFCRWLSKKDGKEYRLPTEAEWEFACRAGTKTQFSFGDDEEEIAKYANVADATFREVTGMKWGIKKSDGFAFAAPVGTYRANAFGIQDMHGNVMQLCSDVYADYPKEGVTEPQGPAAKNDSLRVLRGGCWRKLRIIGSSNEPNYLVLWGLWLRDRIATAPIPRASRMRLAGSGTADGSKEKVAWGGPHSVLLKVVPT